VSAPLPKSLGRYEIQDEIGRGMMGVVYRALDPALGRAVALKTVQLAWALSDEDRQTFEKRFMAEARTAAGLSHPGIVVVHDIGHDPEIKTVFIAMEYLQGQTLSAMMAGGSIVEWREALRIARRVAEALHHAHQAGIVHRDIKPANIMVLPSGDPKIMDFGIAKVPTSQLTTVGEFFGTPSYMSPEQAAGAVVDGRSDVFSLGSVLYLLLTGRRAFDAPSVPAILARIASQDPPPPSRIVPGLPGDVDYVVARALAKAPKDRYSDANTFAEDLADVREGRAPRHRAGWVEPPRAEGTMVTSVEPIVEPETADLWRRAGAPNPRGTARPFPRHLQRDAAPCGWRQVAWSWRLPSRGSSTIGKHPPLRISHDPRASSRPRNRIRPLRGRARRKPRASISPSTFPFSRRQYHRRASRSSWTTP